ncbi:hypothetical protein SEA_ARGIE_77 [Mycobacterium phage Argie]|nr:hypothetical protein SEA_ARGIE_77 [Mycobacterium phage Argie]
MAVPPDRAGGETEKESEMATIYDPAERTADEWAAMAARSVQDAAESWERSDTDGFLSQWASKSSAQMFRHMAELAGNGGRGEIPWVFEKTPAGEWVPVDNWEWIDGKYGARVMIRGEGYGNNRFFSPSQAQDDARRRAADEKKGFRFGRVECEVVSRFGSGWNAIILDERKPGAPLKVVATED